MAATVSVKRATGSVPTNTTVTADQFTTADVANDGTAHPMVKPGTGLFNYSFVSWYRLNADTAPAGTINNVKFYTDGVSGYGIGVTAKGITTPTYSQAVGTVGTSGTLSATVYTAGADIFGWTTGSPLSVPGTLTATTGIISDYVAIQMRIADTASASTLSAETMTWRYDET